MERPDRAAGRYARHLARRLPGPYLSAVMSGTARAKHFAPPEAATSGPRNLAGLGRAALEAEVRGAMLRSEMVGNRCPSA